MERDIKEAHRREGAINRFIGSAVSGDVKTFFRATMEIDWPGAWLDIFTALDRVSLDVIGEDIRWAFVAAWRGDLDVNSGNATNLPVGLNWTMTRDLEADPALLVHCLRKLLPVQRHVEAPLVLYRGQSLAEHQRGAHGVWWTAYPLYAETFARCELREHVGQGAVLAALSPANAIVYRLNGLEFLVDPSKLAEVRCIDVPPRHTDAERALSQLELDAQSRLMGIPAACQTDLVREWIERGMPAAGLERCRRERAAFFAAELTA